MSQAMKGLVETSNNLAIVRCIKGKFEAHNLTRSSVDSSKESTAWRIASVFQLIDAKSDSYRKLSGMETQYEFSYPENNERNI